MPCTIGAVATLLLMSIADVRAHKHTRATFEFSQAYAMESSALSPVAVLYT